MGVADLCNACSDWSTSKMSAYNSPDVRFFCVDDNLSPTFLWCRRQTSTTFVGTVNRRQNVQENSLFLFKIIYCRCNFAQIACNTWELACYGNVQWF